jgi:hypothetical protein
MLEKGMPMQDIADILDITLTELEAIQKNR